MGRGLSRSARVVLNTSVFAAMPRPSDTTASTTRPGLRRNVRAAYRISCKVPIGISANRLGHPYTPHGCSRAEIRCDSGGEMFLSQFLRPYAVVIDSTSTSEVIGLWGQSDRGWDTVRTRFSRT